MFRAILELIVTIVIAMAARAILGNLMKSFNNASRSGFNASAPPQQPPRPDPNANNHASTAGELHKDPVCGTYVAESTKFKRGAGRETFYYCSEVCKDKHAVAARS